MTEFPEILQLATLRERHQIAVEVTNDCLEDRNDFRKVQFSIGKHLFEIFVDDEFQDFQINNPELHLCLVLRSLEAYQEAEDFLVWCKHHGLNPANTNVRQHHMALGTIYIEIEQLIGPIDSFVSDLDFQLNAGVAQKMRTS